MTIIKTLSDIDEDWTPFCCRSEYSDGDGLLLKRMRTSGEYFKSIEYFYYDEQKRLKCTLSYTFAATTFLFDRAISLQKTGKAPKLETEDFSYRIYFEYLSDYILCEDGRMCYANGQSRKLPPPCTLQAVMPQRILECYIDKPSFLLEMIKCNEKHLNCKELLTVRVQEKCPNPSNGLCPSAFSIVPKDFLNDMKEVFETMSANAIQYHEMNN